MTVAGSQQGSSGAGRLSMVLGCRNMAQEWKAGAVALGGESEAIWLGRGGDPGTG